MKATARRRDGYAHEVEIEGGHALLIDEPVEAGGADEGPSPTRVVAAALAGCTAITVEMYAGRKGWDLGEIEVEADLDSGAKGSIESFAVTLRVPRSRDAEQQRRLTPTPPPPLSARTARRAAARSRAAGGR